MIGACQLIKGSVLSPSKEFFFFWFNQLSHFPPYRDRNHPSVPYHYYEPFGPDECTMYLSHERGRKGSHHRFITEKRVFKNWARTFNIHFFQPDWKPESLPINHPENKPVFWGMSVPDQNPTYLPFQTPGARTSWATRHERRTELVARIASLLKKYCVQMPTKCNNKAVQLVCKGKIQN